MKMIILIIINDMLNMGNGPSGVYTYCLKGFDLKGASNIEIISWLQENFKSTTDMRHICWILGQSDQKITHIRFRDQDFLCINLRNKRRKSVIRSCRLIEKEDV